MRTNDILPVVAGLDGYVSEPASFHDAVMSSINHTGTTVEIRVQSASTPKGPRNLVIRCVDPSYTFLSAAHVPGVIFGLWLFTQIWDETFSPPIDNGARAEFDTVKKIINENANFTEAERKGNALWFEPCMDNPMLIICSHATIEFCD